MDESWANDILDWTAAFLTHAGLDPARMARRFAQTCRIQRPPRRRFDPRLSTYGTQLGQILALWYLDPEYVDAESGQPRGLALRAAKHRGPSLEAVIKRVLPSGNVNVVARDLMRMGAVRRVGPRYLPVRRFVSLAECFPLAHLQSLGAKPDLSA